LLHVHYAKSAARTGETVTNMGTNTMHPQTSATEPATLTTTAQVAASDAAIAELVGQVFEAAPAPEKRRLLAHLIRPLGLLSLVAVANGIFAKLRFRDGWQDIQPRLEDVQKVHTSDVVALVDHVQQVSVEVVDNLAHLLKASPVVTGSAAAAVLVTILLQRANARRSRTPQADIDDLYAA
jgi:hypothetical protein